MQMSSVGFTEAFKGGNAKTAHWREKKTNLSNWGNGKYNSIQKKTTYVDLRRFTKVVKSSACLGKCK